MLDTTSLNDFFSLSSFVGGSVGVCLRFELKQRCNGLHVLILYKLVDIHASYHARTIHFYLTTGFVNVANLIQCALFGIGFILLEAIMNRVRVC